MAFNVTNVAGTMAAITSMASFASQAWKIIKTRETKDLSTIMYGLTVLGFALWSIYGMMIGQWPIIASNIVCLSLSAFILTMKILPAWGKRKVAGALDHKL